MAHTIGTILIVACASIIFWFFIVSSLMDPRQKTPSNSDMLSGLIIVFLLDLSALGVYLVVR